MNFRQAVGMFALLGLLGAGAVISPADEPPRTLPRHFLVLMDLGPGYDPSVGVQEQKAFPAHAAYMSELESRGQLVFGGPLLESFASMRPTGAILVLRAETAEEARAIAAADPSGLLAVQEVRPFLLAVAARQ